MIKVMYIIGKQVTDKTMNTDKNLQVSRKIDSEITQIFSNQQLQGFEKALKLSEGISQLRTLLDKNYMSSIMGLQGSKIGFRTDKDKESGYSEDVVKDCLIEAVLIGLQPAGNHFNIIAGNMYPTKEGFGYLLEQDGVNYTLRFGPTKIDAPNKVARLDVEIEYFDKDAVQQKTILPVSTKWNTYATDDAIQGKATRKARAWLYNKLHGTQISDSDISEVPHELITETITTESIKELIKKKKDLLSNDEISRIDSVIAEERTKDYKKVFDFLTSKK